MLHVVVFPLILHSSVMNKAPKFNHKVMLASYCAFQMGSEISFKCFSAASNQIVAMLPRCIPQAGRQECYSKSGLHILATVCDYSRLIGYGPNRFTSGKYSSAVHYAVRWKYAEKQSWPMHSRNIATAFFRGQSGRLLILEFHLLFCDLSLSCSSCSVL